MATGLISRMRRPKFRRGVGMLAIKTFAPATLRALARTWRVEVQG